MYKIMLNSQQVGSVKVEKIGLYYKFNCSCALKDNKIYRVVVDDGKSKIKLGVCVPDGQSFTLSTKIPIKYLQGDDFCFSIESGNKERYSAFNGQPFLHLDKLQTAHLQITDGQFEIIID